MAVTIHAHEPAALNDSNAPAVDLSDALRTALRVSADQLDNTAADSLILAAWGAIESYCGRLVVSRSTTLVVEVVGRAELVDPAGWWTPRPSSIDTLESWDSGTWSDVSADHSPADPLDRYRLEAGWWRFTTTAGADPDEQGDPLLEAFHRVAGFLYDTDPSDPVRFSSRSNLIRLSGAASLLGPYCSRGARVVA